MQRGNLVIYDNSGRIWHQTGEAEGDLLPHEYPNGLPYLELPFGSMSNKRLVSVDITKTPHEPVFETMAPTKDQIIEDLENQILLMADETEGGIL